MPLLYISGQWITDYTGDETMEYVATGPFQATQWNKSGDVPGISGIPCGPATDESVCEYCGKPMHEHGYLNSHRGGRFVCPGDWIVKTGEGARYVWANSDFVLDFKS